jgi:thioredoxin 1
MNMAAIAVNKETFEDEVLKSDMPVLLDFWAPWCGPCQMLGPIVEAIADENPGIKVCKINIDENSDLASQFKIMSIPTLVVMKNGEVYKKSVGVQSKSEILEMVK